MMKFLQIVAIASAVALGAYGVALAQGGGGGGGGAGGGGAGGASGLSQSSKRCNLPIGRLAPT